MFMKYHFSLIIRQILLVTWLTSFENGTLYKSFLFLYGCFQHSLTILIFDSPCIYIYSVLPLLTDYGISLQSTSSKLKVPFETCYKIYVYTLRCGNLVVRVIWTSWRRNLAFSKIRMQTRRGNGVYLIGYVHGRVHSA